MFFRIVGQLHNNTIMAYDLLYVSKGSSVSVICYTNMQTKQNVDCTSAELQHGIRSLRLAAHQSVYVHKTRTHTYSKPCKQL